MYIAYKSAVTADVGVSIPVLSLRCVFLLSAVVHWM